MAHTDDGSGYSQSRVAGRTSSHVGITEYGDDAHKQGVIEFRYYSHGRVDDIHHRWGCPGCDPTAKDDPAKAVWFTVEAKWRLRGDPPTCLIERQAWFNERFRDRPWWVEERDSIAHYRPLPAGDGGR